MADEFEPVEATPPESRGNSGAALWTMALVLLLPVGYVLSIGPVVAVAEKTGRGKQEVEMFYAPVIWLHHHTLLQKPLEWYAKIWGWN